MAAGLCSAAAAAAIAAGAAAILYLGMLVSRTGWQEAQLGRHLQEHGGVLDLVRAWPLVCAQQQQQQQGQQQYFIWGC
jgi:hypothetical protein